MGLKVLHVSLHKMMLSCDLFQGEVKVGVRPAMSLDGGYHPRTPLICNAPV